MMPGDRRLRVPLRLGRRVVRPPRREDARRAALDAGRSTPTWCPGPSKADYRVSVDLARRHARASTYVVSSTRSGSTPASAPYHPDQADDWHLFRLITNRESTIDGHHDPAEYLDVGDLVEGTWDPEATRTYDSIATWHVDEERRTVSLRIPWSMLGFADPSSHARARRGRARGAGRRSTGSASTSTPTASTQRLDFVWQDWNNTGYRERQKTGLGCPRRQPTGTSPPDREVASFGRVSILDDAREGMNPDIRPQDDLFGHVNGRWLDDRRDPQRPLQLGPVRRAGRHRRGAGARRSSRSWPRRPRRSTTDAGKIGDLFASFMDTERIEARRHPADPAGARRASTGSATSATSRRSSASSSGSVATGCSAPTSTPTPATPTATSSTSSRAGSACPTSRTTARSKFAEIREKYVDYLTRLFELAERRRRRGRRPPPTGARDGHPARRRPLGARRDPRRPEDLQPDDRRRAARARPGLRLGRLRPQPRRLGGDHRRGHRAAAVVPRAPVDGAGASSPIDDWKTWLLTRMLRSAAPYLTDDFVETNFDFYGRTLSGTPELRARWKRGVALVEGAVGEAVGKQYVARHFPPRSKELMDDLVANLLEAYRRSITDLDWMTDETKQRAFDKLDTLPAQDRLPRRVPRLLRARRCSPDDLIGNVAARLGVRDRPAAGQDRLAGRPRRVVHAAADRQRLLQPRHQRDLLPGRHPAEAVLQTRTPTRPRTTAASAR